MNQLKQHNQNVLPNQYRVVGLFRSTKPTTSQINDDEFGAVTLRRNAKAKYVRLRMQTDGELVITLPTYAAERHAYELLERSRAAIRSWRERHIRLSHSYSSGERIGQSHTLVFTAGTGATTRGAVKGLTIEITLASGASESDVATQKALRPLIAKALQKEARAYLPRRLSYLAEQYGYTYNNVRFGTQKGRWGSCSSNGTISLNVGLMALEPELIDYVLTHELCHTKNMNHSPQFWAAVEHHSPNYKALRKRLKTEQPTR